MSRPWTCTEDMILRKHYPEGSVAAVGWRLQGRSLHSIKARTAKLGLRVEWKCVIRKPHQPKGYACPAREIAFWLAGFLMASRPRVPEVEQIKDRWNMSRSNAYRWHRWALDKFEQIQARDTQHQECDHVTHVH